MKGAPKWVWLVMLASCATARPTVPFDEAMRAPQVTDAASNELQRFVAATAEARRVSPVGSAMPPQALKAWRGMLEACDGWLDAEATRAIEVVKIRLTLDTELDATIGHYGDVPGALAEQIVDTRRRLSARLATLVPRQRRADPSRFAWPTAPVIVTSSWGDRMHPIAGEARFHAGVDLAAEPAQEIRAAEAGTIVFSGWNGAHGKQIELQHDAHVTTRYSHLMSLLVPVGRSVKRGEVIGLAGATGQATGPHLHFEVRIDGESTNPEAALPLPPEGDSQASSTHASRSMK